MADDGGQRLTAVGVIASVGLIGALVCMGAAVFLMGQGDDAATSADPVTTAQPTGDQPAVATDLGLIAHEAEVPRLDPAAPYVPKDGVVEIELSEYAGYAGLIAANGGLAPNPDSVFAKKHGFQVKLTVSEADAWSPLNAGRIGASATTADVLPLYGRQFEVVVPAQIGFSRGADGIVVDKEIHRLNDLRGKVLVSGQFSEAEFFVRYLAQEAGIPVKVADEPVPADSESITLVFAEDAFAAGDAYLADLKGANQLAGCVTWDPKTTEVVDASGGGAKVLVTNRNLLVVADVLVVNKGFAEQNPKMVRGLVEGLIEGNTAVRKDPGAHLPTIAKAFNWTEAQAKAELSKVHLSNLPENLAFFGGEIDMAGSFGGIYQSAVYAYGRDIVKQPVGPERFVSMDALKAIQADGLFADQVVEIAPIKVAGAGSIEDDPLLSKDIRFFFEPNSSELDMKSKENLDNLVAINRLLQVSPGSTILLRGHVDGARQEEFRNQGGEKFVREMALKAVQLSTERATEVEKELVATQKADEKRVETVGVGWDEPVSKTDVDKNRRVEVQWFTIE
jgi:NitT/TauT family transport system substrate-binding protein